ncbi:cytochrome P450 83B1-like [Chenopodium quinoa]|uniref:Cytochrome P450 n=1 Tax=Chenopodium quinoa TaxID=63459 RepID=A0A803LKA4_CHEQI|nr:cytochrome P450 83B1-like [Chenopodium quinoa]
MLLIFPLLATLFLTIIYFLRKNPRKNESFHPPTGPKGIPFIGNLHQYNPSNPHIYFANLAKIYGPILSLRFGRVPVVVVQSAKLAKEVLQTQDLNFCSRPPIGGMKRLSYNGLDIAFTPYNEYFKKIKKISVVHLLSSKRVESFAPIRQEEVSMMMHKISSLSSASKPVNLSELLMSFTSSNICRIAFGKRYEDDEGSRSKYHSLLNEAEALLITFFYSDILPYFGWLDKLTGKFSRLEKTFKKLDAFYEEVINDHINPNKPKSDREDIIDILLQLRQQQPSLELTLDHIKAVLMNIFIASTDTSAAMVIWAMTELIKHPNSMKNVQEELRNTMQNKGRRYINNDDLKDLGYFKAVVKETFRLHPASPLLIAHETIHRTTIEGYDILPKTLVYVNAWAIGRDPDSWNDPENFVPERFLESSIDFIGCDFELIPFGAGRRSCPGLHLGVANMEVALANLLHVFDWELPAGLEREDIDTNVIPGIAMHKKIPLRLVAKTKLMDQM